MLASVLVAERDPRIADCLEARQIARNGTSRCCLHEEKLRCQRAIEPNTDTLGHERLSVAYKAEPDVVAGDRVGHTGIQAARSKEKRWLTLSGEAKHAAGSVSPIRGSQLHDAPTLGLQTLEHRSMVVQTTGRKPRSDLFFVDGDVMLDLFDVRRVAVLAGWIDASQGEMTEHARADLRIEVAAEVAVLTHSSVAVAELGGEGQRHTVEDLDTAGSKLPVGNPGVVEPAQETQVKAPASARAILQ